MAFCYIIRDRHNWELQFYKYSMKHPDRPFFHILVYYILLIFLAFFLPVRVRANDCTAGRRPLYFFTDSTVVRYTLPVFSSTIFQQLQVPLAEIGYCLTGLHNSVPADTGARDELVMMLSMEFSVNGDASLFSRTNGAETGGRQDTTARMVVALLRVEDWSLSQRRRALKNPLLTLEYSPEELSTFTSVLIRKIVENLRTQYICHLRIQSIPMGVSIRSKTGLEGITPLEWIIPVGKLPIVGELEGFEPIHRRIDLNSPGIHTYVLQMRKRQFYHSKLFIPSLVFAVSSGVCFGMERYYYAKYQKLERPERETDPEAFAHTFKIAKTCERVAAVSLALTGTSFILSFIF